MVDVNVARLGLMLPMCAVLLVTALAADGAAAAAAASASTGVTKGCAGALGCSLNGACVQGICRCAKPWAGTDCGTMRFKPVSYPQGCKYTRNPPFCLCQCGIM